MASSNQDLDLRFDQHPATEESGPVMDELRAAHKELAAKIVDLVPVPRERALALTQLEQSLFWSNAGVARGSAPPPF
jgi:hypothetical protein